MSMSKRIASLTLAVMLLASGVQAYAEESSEVYYKSDIFTRTLGNYEFGVEAHEKPQQEVLPIVDKSLFPYTVTKFATEVDNTAPSATYKSKPISKVDVVFALGELSQNQQLQDYTETFRAKIETASNNIDARIEQVETRTFDISQVSADHIMSTWINYPGSRFGGNYQAGWRASGGRLGATTNVNWTGFWSKEFVDTTDAVFEFNAYIGDHPDPQGWTFRMTESNDVYSFYVLELNHMYNRVNLARINSWVPGSYATHGGPVYHGMINGQDGTYNGGLGQASSYQGAWGELLTSARGGGTAHYRIENKGNNIKVFINGGWTPIIDYTDNSGYALKRGSFGPYTCSQYTTSFGDIKVEMGSTKTLGDAISDVSWRDGSTRFIVHATDVVPDDMKDLTGADYINTVSKLQSSNAYLLNLGTWQNEWVLNRLGSMLAGTDGEVKGVFINNSPITYALDRSAQWIVDKAKGLQKPNDYVLVGEEMSWETQYKDNEKDVPLNFGKNTSDRNLALNWGIGFTDKYKDDSLLAEKWRYRHNNAFYDNSAVRATFSDEWLADSVKVFEQPGLYRVNYKRRDNPIVPDYSLTSIFDNYRYWSTDYDVYKHNN